MASFASTRLPYPHLRVHVRARHSFALAVLASTWPFPTISAANIIAVKAHSAEFNRHGFATKSQPNASSGHPPGQRCKDIMYCSVSLVLQHLRQQLSIIWGQPADELIEAAMSWCIGKEGAFGHLTARTQKSNLIDEVVDDRLVGISGSSRLVHLRANQAWCYQSLPSVSPPFGVHAYHQVVALRVPARFRTLPSPSATFMTVCEVCATAVSHTVW